MMRAPAITKRIQHRPAVDEGGGGRNEDEDFGGVGETVIADGEPGQDVVRQMVEEDQPQRRPRKVEPQLRSPTAGSVMAGAAVASGRAQWRRPQCAGYPQWYRQWTSSGTV